HLRILDDRLDDDVAAGQVVERSGPLQPRQSGVAIFSRELSLLDELAEAFADAADAFVEKLLLDFADHRFVARLRSRLRDARAHEAAAEDSDSLDVCHAVLLLALRQS